MENQKITALTAEISRLRKEIARENKEFFALKMEVERLRNIADASRARFSAGLVEYAERNWKVKKLLTDVGPYEKQSSNIQLLIDKELGVIKWVTYPVFRENDAEPKETK